MSTLKPYKGEHAGIKYQLTPRGTTYQLSFTNPRTHRQVRESTKSGVQADAKVFAQQYIQSYVVDGNDPSKVTVDEIMKAYIATQQGRNREEVQRMWDIRMSRVFAGVQANDVKTADIRAYKMWMAGESVTSGLFQGVKPLQKPKATGTISRDLSNLRAAYRYAYKGEVINKLPAFEVDDNRAARRQGFLQQIDFDAIMRCHMPVWMRALLYILYEVGVRVSEARAITVGQCDFVHRLIRLQKTKNGEPRNPPMTSQMYELLLACAEGKAKSEPVLGAPERWTLRKYWMELVEFAGFADDDRNVLMHDMRRSAVRNMINRGVPERDAMLISGHLTRRIFDDYNIRDERNMRKAAELIEAGAEVERQEAEALEEARQRSREISTKLAQIDATDSEVVVN